MDLDAMTILLGDAIFNIKEEEYCEACQHALKNPYEVRTNDENDERGEALMITIKAVVVKIIIVMTVKLT